MEVKNTSTSIDYILLILVSRSIISIYLLSSSKLFQYCFGITPKIPPQNLYISLCKPGYRLLILDYPKGLNALKFGRTINYPQEKEVIFETELKNIVNINKVKEFYKYTLSDSNYFLLKSKAVQNYLKNL